MFGYGRQKFRCELVVDADPGETPSQVMDRFEQPLAESGLSYYLRGHAEELEPVGPPNDPDGYAFWFRVSTAKKSDLDADTLKELMPVPTIVREV